MAILTEEETNALLNRPEFPCGTCEKEIEGGKVYAVPFDLGDGKILTELHHKECFEKIQTFKIWRLRVDKMKMLIIVLICVIVYFTYHLIKAFGMLCIKCKNCKKPLFVPIKNDNQVKLIKVVGHYKSLKGTFCLTCCEERRNAKTWKARG